MRIRVLMIAVLIFVAAGSGGSAAVGSSDPREQAALLEFMARVNDYVALHRRLETSVPPRVLTVDPNRIRDSSDALAAAIRGARDDARQGDVFTPAATAIFRERIRRGLFVHGDLEGLLADLYEDEPPAMFKASVHARFDNLPYGMPITLLRVLPPLPKELEYRLIGRDFALWDEHAAHVVDFIPDALPPLS